MKKGVTIYNWSIEDEDKYLKIPPENPELVQWDITKEASNFALKMYKNSYFVGLLDSNFFIREGKGIIRYESGRFYEGNWHQDKRHGLGYEKFQTGNTYIGEYHKGKVQGEG